MQKQFFNRDISWLFFNERVLKEAGRNIPIGEKINFLSIYASNLDEFYRVRISALMRKKKTKEKQSTTVVLQEIRTILKQQQLLFAELIANLLQPLREKHNTIFLYDQNLPEEIKDEVFHYFINTVKPLLIPMRIGKESKFFPENDKVYLAVTLKKNEQKEVALINIPSESLSRFYAIAKNNQHYILFLDDCIRYHLPDLFPGYEICHSYSFKITRNAAIDIKDTYDGDMAQNLEKELPKREYGLATRFLYNYKMPQSLYDELVKIFRLEKAVKMPSGPYPNLRDLSDLPYDETDKTLTYKKWKPLSINIKNTVFEKMEEGDFLLNPPYENYEALLQFFKEAAEDESVTEIYLTVYRLAHESEIAKSLIKAAKNGKKVSVFVELKARFDEANNIHWAKQMKAAGVNIIYSIRGWKVHAKIALIKRKEQNRVRYYGVLGTGNFNETTAYVYADHILFTTHKEICRELELVFLFLNKRKRLEGNPYKINFNELLVGRFNLFERLIELIDVEIDEAKKGNKAGITLKLNNLEENKLIKKLYEASNAGVKIKLLVRSICRLVPGVKGMSENIEIRRIVDRYLEHGRIYLFYHRGEEKMFSGSADWMTRNLRRRIEVSFPVYNEKVRNQLKKFIELGFADNVQAVKIGSDLQNYSLPEESLKIQSQQETYKYLKSLSK